MTTLVIIFTVLFLANSILMLRIETKKVSSIIELNKTMQGHVQLTEALWRRLLYPPKFKVGDVVKIKKDTGNKELVGVVLLVFYAEPASTVSLYTCQTEIGDRFTVGETVLELYNK